MPIRTWFGEPLSEFERLLADLTVAPRRNTSFIDVRFRAPEPNEAAKITQAIVDSYKEVVNDRLRDSGEFLTGTLTLKQRELDDKIKTHKDRIEDIRKTIKHWAPDQLVGQQSNRLDLRLAE
ncbi:MAG TPA: hypothetical protein VF813_11460, partial [Anaerolineaceae bacterium]